MGDRPWYRRGGVFLLGFVLFWIAAEVIATRLLGGK